MTSTTDSATSHVPTPRAALQEAPPSHPAAPPPSHAAAPPRADGGPGVERSPQATGWVDSLGGLPVGPVLDRLRPLRGRRLTAPGGVVLSLLLLAPGVALDVALDGSFGLPSTVSFVLASLAAAAAVQPRALATAVVLPPLLFAAAITALARLSGNNDGARQLGLDVGATMAMAAPVLFATTAATLVLVLGRLTVGLARR
ncbi:MAG: DUF6542 domain-containing protein [Actinomycetes bacterium]